MGYITYSLHYERGEVWSETRPFYDLFDMVRLTSAEFTDALAEQYRAEHVYVVSIYANGEDHPVTEGQMRVV